MNDATIQARIERLDEMHAVLSSPEVHELRWPRKHLPEGVNVGDTVSVKVATLNNDKDAQFGRMRKLLEELIN